MLKLIRSALPLLCALALHAGAATGTLRIQGDTVNHPFPLREQQGQWMADASVLGPLLKLAPHWNPSARQLRLGSSAFTDGQPFASVRDSVYALEASPILQDGAFWLPLQAALPALQAASGALLEFDARTHELQASPLKEHAKATLEKMENGELLELRFSHSVKAEGFTNDSYYIVRLDHAQIDVDLLRSLQTRSELISKLTPLQEKGSAQLTLLLRDACAGAELLRRDQGKTLQILLRKKSKVPSSSSAASSSSAQGKALKSRIRTIVLDPGHGGKDPGATGVNGLQEKDVVLDVARKLKKKLQAAGYQVRLTRESDSFVELPERPAMASRWEGDLFISLHCNAVDGKARQKKAEGFKFYILREAESEEDKAIARRENKAIELSASKKGKNEISPVEWILLENQLNAYTKESERFAGYLVESHEGGEIKKMGSGAGQAGFMVLVGAFMPAVLVEVGFITHPEDAAWMGSSQGQDDIAGRLFKAIKSYSKAVGN